MKAGIKSRTLRVCTVGKEEKQVVLTPRGLHSAGGGERGRGACIGVPSARSRGVPAGRGACGPERRGHRGRVLGVVCRSPGGPRRGKAVWGRSEDGQECTRQRRRKSISRKENSLCEGERQKKPWGF